MASLVGTGGPDSLSGTPGADTLKGAGGDDTGMDTAEFGTTEREDWENGTEGDDFDGIHELPAGAVR